MTPRTIQVTRYVTPLREGGSMPAVVEANDDGLYVLKFRGAGQGPRALVAEWIVGNLARALGFDVPEIVFAQLDPVIARTEGDPEIQALVRASDGAPGRALRYAGLDIAGIDEAIAGIAADGDRDNARRLKLAKALGGKAAQPRYEAFLDRAPAFIAAAARSRSGSALRTALDAHAAARDLAGAAVGLSLDAQATVFEMSGIVAALRTSG